MDLSVASRRGRGVHAEVPEEAHEAHGGEDRELDDQTRVQVHDDEGDDAPTGGGDGRQTSGPRGVRGSSMAREVLRTRWLEPTVFIVTRDSHRRHTRRHTRRTYANVTLDVAPQHRATLSIPVRTTVGFLIRSYLA